MKQICVTLLAATLTACATAPGRDCAAGQQAAVMDQLYFGTGRPHGPDVTPQEWTRFVSEEIAPRFPQGFSLIDTQGFTNNFLFTANMIQTGPIRTGVFRSAESTPAGAPQVFPDAERDAMAAQVFTTLSPLRFPYPGEAGSRNNLRGPGYFGIDMGLAKGWKLTERFDLKFAWEVFNVTNSVRFDDNTLTSLDNGSADGAALGVFRRTLTAPRVQQFSLRFTF